MFLFSIWYGYRDFKSVARRADSNKVLQDHRLEFVKKSSWSGIKTNVMWTNQQWTNELHKWNRKFKMRQVYSCFMNSNGVLIILICN